MQDHELTITDYLSLKCSPSWLLCTGSSDDFLGVSTRLSVRLHESCSVSIVDRMYYFSQAAESVLSCCTLAWLEWWAQWQRSSLVQLPVSCGFFDLSPSPSAQLAFYRKIISRCRRPFHQSEVRRWSKRCILLYMKDSHSLLKVYFVLLPKWRKLFGTFANWLKTITWFSFGAYPLSLKITNAQLLKPRKKTPVGCSDLRKQNCFKVLDQNFFFVWRRIY